MNFYYCIFDKSIFLLFFKFVFINFDLLLKKSKVIEIKEKLNF